MGPNLLSYDVSPHVSSIVLKEVPFVVKTLRSTFSSCVWFFAHGALRFPSSVPVSGAYIVAIIKRYLVLFSVACKTFKSAR